MTSRPIQIITGATVVQPGFQPATRNAGQTVIIEGERIREITSETPAGMLLSRQDVEIFDAQGDLLTCGLIDQHINGALGCNFNQDNLSALQNVLKILPRYGVTGILPTVITASPMDMITVIGTLEEAIHHAKPGYCRVLGIHVEGPYIHPEYRGTHPAAEIPESIQLPDLQNLISPNTKIISLAPERDPDGVAISYLAERGIRVMAGHTAASVADMYRAMGQGLCGVTHLFNAMKPLHHRDPGVIGTALGNRELYVEIIGDGVHVHPEALKAVVNAKGVERVILVSDAMQLAGAAEGTHVAFAGTTVTLKQGKAINAEGKLAGAATLLDQCVRNLVEQDVLPFAEAVQTATTTPARFLGLDNLLGTLAPGYLADMVLWDAETLAVKATWVGGHLVYQANGNNAQAATLQASS